MRKITEARYCRQGCGRESGPRRKDCITCYRRLRRLGTLVLPGRVYGVREQAPSWAGDAASYRAALSRILAEKGRADAQRCTRCPRQARDWTYLFTDPDAKVSPKGTIYSTSPSHYAAMCRPCRTIWHRDHATTEVHHGA